MNEKERKMNDRIREILSWYSSENPGVRTNLARMLNHGRLAGTGKMVILPVDQGFEHGPARSFAPNPAGYDPRYHFQLAIEAGCNAYAAPLGFLEAGAADFAGEIPLILKCNNHDVLNDERDPISAVTASVEDALRLGCVAVGFTIYPGSSERTTMYEQLRELTLQAKEAGLAVVVWSYPRGSALSKEGETAVDVVSYAAQIAAQLGAHIIKVKLPSAKVELAEAQKVYQKYEIPVSTLADRVRHVVQSSFDGRRIVIFSGGATAADEQVFDEARAIRDGGGFGSIIGRNSFQRKKEDALKFLGTIMGVYEGSVK
jgi:class I fructose-bisphosphate aldolase